MPKQKIKRTINVYQIFFLALGYILTSLYALRTTQDYEEKFKIDNSDYELEIKIKAKK